MGYKNGFPEKINLYLHKTYNSEDRALGETILETNIRKKSIILFDRGLRSRKIFDAITDKNQFFISRLIKNYKLKITKEYTPSSQNKDTNIIKEQEGYLYSKGGKRTKHIYRTIHIQSPNKNNQRRVIDKRTGTKILAQQKSEKNKKKSKVSLIQDIVNQDIIIVTNIPKKQMSTEEVTKIYRKRWQIETFFKFLKQRLNFSHLINRKENGIKSMLYITIICALMLLVYKKENALSGYKFVKIEFMFETEADLMIETFRNEIDLLKAMLLLVAQFWEKIG